MTWKAVKDSAIADHLADNAIDDYKSLKFDFPNKDVMKNEKCILMGQLIILEMV